MVMRTNATSVRHLAFIEYVGTVDNNYCCTLLKMLLDIMDRVWSSV